ncbi:MAG: NADH-quinone oxidoreductase subunit NuoN [Burkholderiaceae bacterium]|nr:NADH-quinone oxidoreductase subunit NuoN [Burkholderiaceae bacterium]
MENLNMFAALPEIVLLVATSLVLLGDVYVTRRGVAALIAVDRMALLAIVAPLLATIAQLGTPVQYAFDAMYVSDDFARLLKICAYVAVAATMVYARDYVADRAMNRGEFYTLGLFALLGQMVMISANNLLVVYLGLELMSLSLYALAALRRDSGVATEAAIKYFVLGALASGFLLYGMSMIYGGTGSLDLPDIAKAFASGSQANHTVLVFGVVFIVAGLAFKFGAVPFHMWVPDVYQGTPTAVTLMIAGAPKLAAFAIAFRVLAEGLSGVAGDWQQMLTVLSVCSLVIGNLVAIAQTNLKRMLAYSTIAQIGFLLLGLLSGVVDGGMESATEAYGASMFYSITYVLTTLGTFGLIQLMARSGFEADRISDLRGLSRRSPWLALVAMIMMFSLAGIPPTVGFYAKLAVLQAVVNAGQIWLAVLAVLASLVGAFYYLRVVKVMYFDEPTDTSAIEPARAARATLAVNGALVLALGVLPSPLLSACFDAVRQALST